MRAFLFTIIFCVLNVVLAGCSTKPIKENNFKVVNLQPQFREFWKRSEGKPFEVQLKNWDELIEGPNQELFDIMVNNKRYDSRWKKHRIQRLKERFAYFERNYPEVEKEFMRFNRILMNQINRFAQQFPNMRLSMPIIAIPGATFNGKLGSINDEGDLGLAFGIDMMLILRNNPDVLYAHEIFHLYHIEKMGITPEFYETDARFTLPLWIEGLGTYVSELMNPDASPNEILMQRDLASLDLTSDRDPQLLRQMAAQYITIADKKLGEADPKYVERRAWFGVSSADENIPDRIGYLLGLRIARQLSTEYSLAEMISWKPDEAHEKVKTMLLQFAQD